MTPNLIPVLNLNLDILLLQKDKSISIVSCPLCHVTTNLIAIQGNVLQHY